MNANVKRGLLRLWMVAAGLWAALAFAGVVSDHGGFGDTAVWWAYVLGYWLVIWATPTFAILAVGVAVTWVVSGFRGGASQSRDPREVQRISVTLGVLAALALGGTLVFLHLRDTPNSNAKLLADAEGVLRARSEVSGPKPKPRLMTDLEVFGPTSHPLLRWWQENDPVMWAAAQAVDSQLEMMPEWQRRPVTERFQEVVSRLTWEPYLMGARLSQDPDWADKHLLDRYQEVLRWMARPHLLLDTPEGMEAERQRQARIKALKEKMANGSTP